MKFSTYFSVVESVLDCRVRDHGSVSACGLNLAAALCSAAPASAPTADATTDTPAPTARVRSSATQAAARTDFTSCSVERETAVGCERGDAFLI